MTKLKVAVTGGSGRIGSKLIRHLLERGHEALNLDQRQAREPLARFIYIDLRRREQVQPVLETVDAVCHLGEIPNIDVSYSQDEVYAHNTQAGAVVMQTAADLKLQRVIYTSSCQVYGCYGRGAIAPARLPFDETLPLRPQNAYGLSKKANEEYAEIVAKQQGLSVAIFRFPGVLNFSNDDLESWLWLDKATGKCSELATYVNNEDVARAYVLALENPRPGCEAYHFVSDDVLTATPIRERLMEHHPDVPVLPKDWLPYKSPVLTDKARAHFGWKPEFNIIEMFKKKFGRYPGK